MDAIAEKDLELVLARTFDAPRRLVFDAWTKSEYVMKWLGPKGAPLTKCTLDFRAGGVFAFTMQGADGSDYPFDGTFEEIVTNERIVFKGAIHDGNFVTTTITFADDGAKTALTVRQMFTKVTDSSRGARTGWTETLDHLDAFIHRRS